jgi:hypothetical protein
MVVHLLFPYKCLPFRLMSHFFGHTSFKKVLLNVLMSSLYRGLNTYIFLKLKECLASLSANSFPSIPTEHFLLHCRQYDTYRQTMIDQLLQLGVTNFNLTILLSGKNFQPVAHYKFYIPCP